ncbi:MAG: aminopeptidase P family protein, partial [Pseudomonadota bacterium]
MTASLHSIPNPKIDPTRRRPDNTPDDNDRVEIGPTPLAYAEWAEAGLECPDLQEMRRFRWQRLVEHIVERDWAGVLLFDPLNIRYATDTTHMQLWNT